MLTDLEHGLTDNASIAVIVPVYNEARNLECNLQAFLDLKADTLLFIDGGSTDASRQILAQAGVHWLTSSLGRAAQMNAGAKICADDILIFIHVDTDISESDLSEVKHVMQASDEVGGRFDVRLSGRHWLFRVIEKMINLRSRITKISTGDQAMFVRRSVFEALGGFPLQALMEDVEFSRRLKSMGQIACLRATVTTSSRRWEQYGIVRTIWLMWTLRLLYWLGVPPEKLSRMYR